MVNDGRAVYPSITPYVGRHLLLEIYQMATQFGIAHEGFVRV